MRNAHYIRALYDETRQTYFIPDGDLPEGMVVVKYTFVLLDMQESAGKPTRDGALLKAWCDQDNGWDVEFFLFQDYANQQAFDEDIHHLLTSARDAAFDENVDEFLCVLDAVKWRAIEAGYEDDESLLDCEGLFERGPEDAYTLRDLGDVRLHDHLERADECWRLQVGPVVDNQNHPLGWSVFVIHFPTLLSSASDQDMLTAQQGRVLELRQHPDELMARLELDQIEAFMVEGDRIDDPEFACMDDTVVFECLAEGRRAEGGLPSEPAWRDLSAAQLAALLNGSSPTVCSHDEWRPDDKDIITKFFEEHPQPPGIEDQFRAILSDQLGIKVELDENSPWNGLDID